MAFIKIVFLGLALMALASCGSGGQAPCGKQTRSITWSPPAHLEGTFNLKVYFSNDGEKWQKVSEETSQEINSNGVHTDLDTCAALYWYAEMNDNYGHCSQESSCIGKLCKEYRLPNCGL